MVSALEMQTGYPHIPPREGTRWCARENEVRFHGTRSYYPDV
jgi:hypothetical protein